ncbi:hypothetical protein GCK72_018940 [Caenorhabditis remanei]|uniref:T20D4.11-like domain-containing protein n=1 Tax=Caenorhabditis remanei TaxID=31234 RepID=A0A6A5GCN2_CAERE|nr:hypothetical protein GCK72_018940 [Caenorhabditis remanei]KAF1752385.1 hypothetical protein GCK72_018940 [Caenorhabditis remanei]
MSSFLKLVVVGTILLGLAHGASVATAESKESNCTVADGFQALSCLMRLSDFSDKIDELDMNDKNEVKEFKRSCDSLHNCFATLTCKKPDVETQNAVNSIRNYCDAVVYVSSDFAECSDKLENMNSKCFEDWEPFPESIDEERDEKKKEEMKKEACKNYFGKDNCLKKEITETCSEQEWMGFRDHFISISSLVNNCDFGHLVN